MNWLQNKLFTKKVLTYIFFLFLFFYYRIVEINRPLWGDELITLKTLNSNPLLNPFYAGVSTNLPLFYYLIKIYDLVTLNFINLRSLNILLAIATILFVFKKYNFISNFQKAVLVLFLALSPIQIYYSLELRTYLLAQFLIILNYYYLSNKEFKNWYWLSLIGLLLTHYACYIYILASFLYLIIFRKIDKKTYVNFLLIALAGIIILFFVSKNPGFNDSTSNSILAGDLARISANNLVDNFLKLREVLTIYYNFGLHYYRMENSYLSIFKKFMQILLLVYGFYILFRTKKFSEFEIQTFFIFLLVMLGSIMTDLIGIMPFGGPHIFPFHFLYLILLTNLISKISEINKAVSYLIITVILSSYLIYNTCLSFNLKDFVGNNDPQGVLISKCIGK